jgi:transcriptional regulator with XRE-family HTH domain
VKLDAANIGPRVRERADKLNMTLAAVARAAGIKPQNLNRLLAGERPDPRASTLIALASALRCRVDDLLR